MALPNRFKAGDSEENNEQQHHQEQHAAHSRTTEDRQSEDSDRGGDSESHQTQETTLDGNNETYQQMNNVIRRTFDFSLFISNVNRFRTLLDSPTSHPYFYFNISLLSISLILQIFIAVGLIQNSSSDRRPYRPDNHIFTAMLILAIINVFITAFE